MSGNFTVTVQEARGFVAVPADIDALAVVMGFSSLGSGLSPFFLSGSTAVIGVGFGDAVDDLTQIIEQSQPSGTSKKVPAAIYSTPGSVPGSYGTIDTSGVLGTSVITVDPTSQPFGTYHARIKIISPGTVGTTGITYQSSLDDGRNFSNTTALGSAGEILIPNSGVRFLLAPPTSADAALFSSVNAVRAAAIAHFVIVTGSPPTHAASDTIDNAALTAVPAATTIATAIAAFNACLEYLSAHVSNAGGVYHTTADTVAEAALAAIPNAFSADDVADGLPALVAAYNAHRILVGAGPVHGTADSTNTAAASTASTGTLLVGDMAKVRTFAPAPSSNDIDAAFAAMAAAPADFALVVCEWDCTASLAAHVSLGLNALLAAGKRVTALVRTRLPFFEMQTAITGATNANPIVITATGHGLTSGQTANIAGVVGNTAANGMFVVTVIDSSHFSIPVNGNGSYTSGGIITESEAAWSANISLDWSTFTDSRIVKRATYEFVTDAITARQYRRSDLAQFAADVVRVPRFVWPDAPADQPMANATLIDATGTTIGHDEGPRGAAPGLSNDTLGNTFSCVQRLPDPDVREALFNTVPWVAYAFGERIRNLMTRRVANAMERVAVSAGTTLLGGIIFYIPADPSVPSSLPTLTDASRNAVQGVIFRALVAEFSNDIQNATDAAVDTGLVQVNPVITVSGGNLIGISLTIAPKVLGYLLTLGVTFAVQE